jgi:hypothetical protein
MCVVMVLAESQVFIRVELNEMVSQREWLVQGGGLAVVVVALCGL